MSVRQTSIIFRTLQCGLRILHGQKPRHLYCALYEESDNQRRIILLRCQNQHTMDSIFYPISEIVSKKVVAQDEQKLKNIKNVGS